MQTYTAEYTNVIVFLCLGVALGAVLMLLTFLFSQSRSLDSEKLSPYECGFDPFDDCRAEFSIHFYLLGIMFIVFDLEVVLLLPWALNAGTGETFALWAGIDFLLELALGFACIW